MSVWGLIITPGTVAAIKAWYMMGFKVEESLLHGGKSMEINMDVI